MSKNGYIVTAAKYLTVTAVLLLVNNLLTNIGAWVPYAALVSQKTYIVTLVVAALLMYVAFNGEGVGHKRSLQRSGKRAEHILKLLLVVSFLYFYSKNRIVAAVNLSGAVWLRVMLSALTVVASYSFVLCAVSLWYLIRDRKNAFLTAVNAAAFVISAVYEVYKFFYYASVSFGAIRLGETALRVLGSNTLLQLMCILQYVVDIFMFLCVYKVYTQNIASEEGAVSSAKQKKHFPVRRAYNNNFFGTDTLEDDWLVNTPESEALNE